MSKDLRTTIIVDYQNVHLTGHGLFGSTRALPLHETLVDPLLFGQHLLRARNARQRPGMASAVLRRILVYRGQPSPDHDSANYARNLAQKAHWERDPRVEVTLRPLKYEYLKDAAGIYATDIHGKRIVSGKPREKGVDVLCALAAIREAQDPGTDLVILASSDSDLSPCSTRSDDWGLQRLRPAAGTTHRHGAATRSTQRTAPSPSGTLASMRPPSEHAGTHSPTHDQERHLLSRMRTWRPTPSVRHPDDFGQRSHQERGRAQDDVTRLTHAMTSAVTSSRFVSLSVSCRAPS